MEISLEYGFLGNQVTGIPAILEDLELGLLDSDRTLAYEDESLAPTLAQAIIATAHGDYMRSVPPIEQRWVTQMSDPEDFYIGSLDIRDSPNAWGEKPMHYSIDVNDSNSAGIAIENAISLYKWVAEKLKAGHLNKIIGWFAYHEQSWTNVEFANYDNWVNLYFEGIWDDLENFAECNDIHIPAGCEVVDEDAFLNAYDYEMVETYDGQYAVYRF